MIATHSFPNTLDLKAQVSRNNHKLDFVPQTWGEGAWCGSVLLSCMVLGDGRGSLKWEFGRTDVMNRSFGELNSRGHYENKRLHMVSPARRRFGIASALLGMQAYGKIKYAEAPQLWSCGAFV